MNKKLLLACFALSLIGCDKVVKIKNGELPAELVPYAQRLTGDYVGRFAGISNTLHVSLNGNHLSLSADADLLGSACASSIGNLTEVSYSAKDKDNVELRSASFELDPGACVAHYEGRDFVLSGKTDRNGVFRLQARMLTGHHYENHYEPGYTQCSTDGRGRTHCWRTPGTWESRLVNEYAYGEFDKR